MEEVHTYAELKRDPRADLPSSFTICSNVMTTYGSEQTFFTLLGKDGNKWLTPFLMVADRTSFSYVKWAGVKLPPVFAHQWVRSCIAVNTESGLLQWVVDGALVENATVAQVKDSKNKPSDLTGKIVLGTWQWNGSKKWETTSNRVTNLNVYSTALTAGEMQQHTIGGSCIPEGDCLAWNKMQWNLKVKLLLKLWTRKSPVWGTLL